VGRKGKFKLKTHKATAKRFRQTSNGEIVRTVSGKGHLRRNTPKRTKRMFSKMVPVKSKKLSKRVRRLAPYLSKYKANPNARTGQSS